MMKIFFLLLLAFSIFARADDDVPDGPKVEVVEVGKIDNPMCEFSDEEDAKINESASVKSYNTDVMKMLDILTHSLYKDKQIVWRELISNADDALEKVHLMSLTGGLKDKGDLEIRVRVDPEAGLVSIQDTGIGMSADDLTENLGTIARSGTQRFMDAAEKSQSSDNFIGMFGVGFYSSFLVSEDVTVVSKKDDNPRMIWKSKSDGKFSISEDPRPGPHARGTTIILKLKEDAKEFLNQESLKTVIKRYSEFTNHPIYLYWKEETEEQVDDEEAIAAAEAAKAEKAEKGEDDEETAEKEEDELEAEDEEEDDEPVIPKKTVKTVTYDWKRINTQPPVWSRSPDAVTETEYVDFFKAFAGSEDEPLSKSHFKAEGQVVFNSLLYIPKSADYGFYDRYMTDKAVVRVYVRRVLIDDKYEDLLPRYLKFVKGLIDSNDLPLNVNRESLQLTKEMKVISRKVTRKALDMIRKMAEASEPNREDEEEEEETDDDGEKEKKKEEEETTEEEEKKDEDLEDSKNPARQYFAFWKQFGKSIKLGVLEDQKNEKLLKKMLRYVTSETGEDGDPISLETYVSRMKKGQKGIFYLTGDSFETIRKSPSLERILKAGYEVVYMTDPLDEFVIGRMQDFDGTKLVSVAKENLELKDSSKAEKKHFEEVQEDFKPLCEFIQKKFDTKLDRVEVSKRLESSVAVLVSTQWGMSAFMEKIQRAQPMAQHQPVPASKRILEINYRHPIVKELKRRVDEDSEPEKSSELEDYVAIIYDSAVMSGGFQMEDVSGFSDRIEKIVRHGLSIPDDAEIEAEKEFEDDEPAEEDDEKDDVFDEEDDEGHTEL